MTKTRRKSYSCVDISWLILKYRKRDSVFNFVVNNLTAQDIGEKLDRLLDKLKSAVKLNLALGFILKNIEDGKFRYFYAHENNTLLEQSKLVSNKDDLAKLEEILKKKPMWLSHAQKKGSIKSGGFLNYQT